MWRRFIALAAVLFCSSCGSMQVADFANERRVLDPMAFFTGKTTSSGVMENRGGAPREIVTTTTSGRREGGVLVLEQDLKVGGKPQHRSWRIRKLGAHHFQATANDVVGTASGEADGNVFTWSFALALSPGNPLANVRMTQWMYLQPDGRTLLNHSTIRELGFVVAQVTEVFRKQ